MGSKKEVLNWSKCHSFEGLYWKKVGLLWTTICVCRLITVRWRRKDEFTMVWMGFTYSPFHVFWRKIQIVLKMVLGFSTEVSLKAKMCQYRIIVHMGFTQLPLVVTPLILPWIQMLSFLCFHWTLFRYNLLYHNDVLTWLSCTNTHTHTMPIMGVSMIRITY